jgi:Snare region anchored in the vesicle membrane C-terminus
MESIAVDTKHNLAGQSEQLGRVQNNLNNINREANAANKTMG